MLVEPLDRRYDIGKYRLGIGAPQEESRYVFAGNENAHRLLLNSDAHEFERLLFHALSPVVLVSTDTIAVTSRPRSVVNAASSVSAISGAARLA